MKLVHRLFFLGHAIKLSIDFNKYDYLWKRILNYPFVSYPSHFGEAFGAFVQAKSSGGNNQSKNHSFINLIKK